MKTTLLALATALLLAACGGGDPLPEDCVPASFVGPLPEGIARCDSRVPTPRVDCSVPGVCG